MEENLKRVNLFQAGSRPNRSPSDNLFMLRAAIDHQKYKGKALYVTTYDFEQAFDSLWLQDCVMTLMRLGVPKDILHLVYNLNKEANITINTPYGLTSPTKITDIVEQGTVLGSNLCSSSTAEYCEMNKGIYIGPARVKSLLYVDDISDLSYSREDAVRNHDNAIIFSRMKKLSFSKTKCKTIIVNRSKGDIPPDLYIDGEKIESVPKVTYLGDVINEKGNNKDLIDDRLQRGTSAMIRIEALVKETCLGIYTIQVHLLLYRSLFIPCVLFNSQTWSNLLDSDLERLGRLQLKCLKKILNVPQSTSNSFTYLEFGVLPIMYEIQLNQLMFLHHIIHLQDDDPVKSVFDSMTFFPEEKNWWHQVRKLLEKYQINLMWVEENNREVFRKIVKQKITSVALRELNNDCQSKAKTRHLMYEKLAPQDYLNHLYPTQSKVIFQCRSKTLDIKTHRQYKYLDTICRRCRNNDESIDHVSNCQNQIYIDTSLIDHLGIVSYEVKLTLITISNRIEEFLNQCE